MLRRREGKNTREKVNEVDEKGRGIRERTWIRRGMADLNARMKLTGVGRKEKKTKGMGINTA
jgi:hypothetical protein